MRSGEDGQTPGTCCDFCGGAFVDEAPVMVPRPTNGLDRPPVLWPYHERCRREEALSRRISTEERGMGSAAALCIAEAPCKRRTTGGK